MEMLATDDYLENQVMTASPYQLHQMVVEGAIRFARRGLAALEAEQWEPLGTSLARARNCVSELIGGLNDDKAPELARQTRSIFLFIYRNLALAEMERSPQRIHDALKLLAIYRETWLELGRKLQGEAVALESHKTAPRSSLPAPHLAPGRCWVT
jgi:flagellar protein FliS